MPGNKGDIIRGIEGASQADVDEWIETVKTRVAPRFSICPEILSHHKAVDLNTGKLRRNEVTKFMNKDQEAKQQDCKKYGHGFPRFN